LRNVECNGERNRALCILKARGMAHSNQAREMLLTDHGIQLLDVYSGSSGLLTGSARVQAEARQSEEAAEHSRLMRSKSLELACKRQQLELEIAKMRAAFEEAFEREEQTVLRNTRDVDLRRKAKNTIRAAVGHVRQADEIATSGNGRHAGAVAVKN